MKDTIKNIISRLIQYSKQMDKVETFVEPKSWLYLDNSGNKHEYIFMRDHRLIMSVNGTAVIGKWELLPNEKLLIDRVSDKIMLKNQFIDDALMILQKSDSDDEPFVLVDEQIIQDHDVLKYLKNIEEKRITSASIEKGTVEILSSGFVRFKGIEIGYRVKHYEGLIVSGSFDLNLSGHRRFMVVENGIITDLYYLVTYTDELNREIEICQKATYLASGSRMSNIHPDEIDCKKIIYVKEKENPYVAYKIKIDLKGIVTIIYKNDSIFVAVMVICIILILLSIFFKIP
jgi:hypothetical protein